MKTKRDIVYRDASGAVRHVGEWDPQIGPAPIAAAAGELLVARPDVEIGQPHFRLLGGDEGVRERLALDDTQWVRLATGDEPVGLQASGDGTDGERIAISTVFAAPGTVLRCSDAGAEVVEGITAEDLDLAAEEIVVLARGGEIVGHDENNLIENNPLPEGLVRGHADIVHADDGSRRAVDDHAGLRAAAYPPIADQLDALWKGGADAEAMRKEVLAVKARFPKVNG